MFSINSYQIKRHPILTGTFLLTAAGFLSRLMGFFYRIFLSRNYGAGAMGIFQLTAPIIALVYSFSSSGIQTAVSKMVAANTSDTKKQKRILYCSIFMSLILSAISSMILYSFADKIAVTFLKEKRAASLLRILALSVPMSAIHSCVSGYFFGLKKAIFPAITQLAEQTVKIVSVYILLLLLKTDTCTPTINLMALGVVLGEIASMLICLLVLWFPPSKNKFSNTPPKPVSDKRNILRELLTLSVPLCLSRVLIQLVQSLEAAAIPDCLIRYGYTHDEALSFYGTLTGMSLPYILFPMVLTGSIAVMLLPVIAEAKSKGDFHKIDDTITKSIRYSFLIGLVCTVFFLCSANIVGVYLFHSQLAAHYIKTLGFLCPFLYIAGTLISILNGLGKTFTTFVISAGCMIMRYFFIRKVVPLFGMEGYLWCILLSQIMQTLFCVLCARTQVRNQNGLS